MEQFSWSSFQPGGMQNKARTKHEKNRWISPWLKPGKISPKVTMARGSINSQLAKQLVPHQLHVSAVSRQKNGSEESRRKPCYERATSKNKTRLFFIVGFFIVWIECLLETSPGHLPLVCFCFVEVRSLPFVVCLCWPRLKRLRLERDWNAIAFPRSSIISTRKNVGTLSWLHVKMNS